MPQTANLFGNFRGPAGNTPQGSASTQGIVLANLYGRTGATYFVDETLGSDSQVRAGYPFSPFATLAAALAVAVAGDTIFVSGTIHVTATLTVSQNNLAIIGLNSPSQNSRARISSSGNTVFTPMVSVTGQGCRFENLATFYGYDNASTQICWTDTGGRNFYKNVLFGGGGNATAAAQAGMRCLTLGGNGENLFEDCTFGLSTVARATNANATLEILAGQRNKFVRPVFDMYSSLAGNCHIKVGAGALGGANQFFFDTIFSNPVDGSATSITVDVICDVAANGGLIFGGTVTSVGAGKVASTGPVYTTGTVPTAGTSGLAVKST
jgi:hypothetical protein